MDWNTLDFDWNYARAFLAVAEEGSYSAAARALGVAQPTIGRQITALEESLQVTLFERVGRGWMVTPTGLALLEHVREMAEAATRVRALADGRSVSLEGLVRITASEVVSAHLLPPIVARVRGAYPGIELELVASNQVLDLSRHEADIALRNAAPQDPELVGRKLGVGRGWLYASDAYLAGLGDPPTPESLSAATFISFDRSSRMRDLLESLGLPLTERNFPLVSGNQLVQWEMARQGMGICFMMEEIGDATPGMSRVVPEVCSVPVPMWLVSRRELATSRRVRLVFDMLADGLSSAR
jgi:DNA-binding transcriptional LysR family regulator